LEHSLVAHKVTWVVPFCPEQPRNRLQWLYWRTWWWFKYDEWHSKWYE